jgi:hypothetical protein
MLLSFREGCERVYREVFDGFSQVSDEVSDEQILGVENER